MTDTVATFCDVRSCGRSAPFIGKLGALLARRMLFAAAALAAIGLVCGGVTLSAGWLLATLHADGFTLARKHFGPRSIALLPQFPSPADDAKAADIVVFPPTLAETTAPPAHVAKRLLAPEPEAAARPPIAARPQRHGPRMAVVSAPPLPPPAPEIRAVPPSASGNATRLSDRTAIYDIASQKVYLPNGKVLEAHSGLGRYRDDPRYVSLRMRGPTPPNTYDLTLREKLFHGVRAIRLTPVNDDKMFGRDGMLAHTYMLGPRGDSNGCVSFKDYRAFLEAYLKGDVDRLVVVARDGEALARTARVRGMHFAAND